MKHFNERHSSSTSLSHIHFHIISTTTTTTLVCVEIRNIRIWFLTTGFAQRTRTKLLKANVGAMSSECSAIVGIFNVESTYPVDTKNSGINAHLLGVKFCQTKYQPYQFDYHITNESLAFHILQVIRPPTFHPQECGSLSHSFYLCALNMSIRFRCCVFWLVAIHTKCRPYSENECSV